MDTTTEKPKRQMTEEQLEKLKQAREKALEKKREIRALIDAEKEMKQLNLEQRKKKVEDFYKSLETTSTKQDTKKKPEPESEFDSESSSDDEVVEQVIVKKRPKTKKKVVRKIIEVSSSSDSDSDSSDDEDYHQRIKNKYKTKYKNKYAPAPRDVVKEQASDVIRSNVSKELRKIAFASVFPS